jgi:predicted MFS family arabinose efflux permease
VSLAGHGSDPAAVAPRHWRQDLRLLRQHDLGLVVASRLVSDLGTGMAPIALAFGVLGLPGGDAQALGLVLLCAAVPRLLFFLVGGVLADRVDRARLMVGAELMAFAAQLVAAALFVTGHASVPAVAVLAAVNGIAVALFSPSLTGLVPQVAADDDLQSANALIRLSSHLASILGTVLGGVLVATVGPGWALAVDSLTFAISAVLLSLVRARSEPSAEHGSVVGDLREGWREFSARRWVWLMVLLFSLSNMGFTAGLAVLGPVRALESYGGARGWALVLAGFSVGTVVGVLVAMRLRPGRPLFVAAAAQLVVVLPLVAIAPPLPLVAAIACAFVAGVAIDVFEVLWQTALQQNIPRDSLSRVASYDWLGSLALTPLALVAAGALAASMGLSAAIWVSAVFGAAGSLALLDPQVRDLRAGRPAAPSRPGGDAAGGPS